ncbi:MAG: NifB/NifX family molybdenum-iron cluster-binding protein [Thermoleophilia bacterium]
MKVCFPVQADDGLESTVYGHFGSAPMFVVVDAGADSISVINNQDMHHEHGACNPAKALEGHNIDAIVVGGIGGGALMKLNQAGMSVFQAAGSTIRDNIELLSSGKLPMFQPGHVCGGHAVGGGCSH